MPSSTNPGGQSGARAGKTQNRDNFIAAPSPRGGPPPVVDEVEPLYATYAQAKPEGSYYDEARAERAVQFIEALVHYQGVFAGHPFTLQHWQARIVRELFGWMTAEGVRLYRLAYIEVPRKQGKTTFAAAIALLLAYDDDEPGAQVYFAAADKDQAGYGYNAARIMLQQVRALAEKSVIYNSTKRILIPDTNSELRCLSSETRKLYGLNLHGLVFDELMAQKDRVLWDALTTAQGSRLQPLIIAITTAGFNRESIAYEHREYARQIANGALSDPTFLGVVYAAPDDADFRERDVWYAAAPSLGATVQESYYAEKARQAEAQPSAQNSFRTLLLCQWVGQATRLIPMVEWDACGELPVPDFSGRDKCYGGLDLSSSIDLTAFVLDFPLDGGRHAWVARIFIPELNLRDRGLRDRAPYQVWVDQGWITPTPGSVIDYAYVRAAIREAAERYNLVDISYDRWGATQLANELEADGFTMAKMGQGFASMTAPTKEMLRLVVDGKLLHGGNPVLKWMADNAAGATDPAGNLKLARDRSNVRIDGLVAGVMALDGGMRRGGPPKRSVYDEVGPDDIYDMDLSDLDREDEGDDD